MKPLFKHVYSIQLSREFNLYRRRWVDVKKRQARNGEPTLRAAREASSNINGDQQREEFMDKASNKSDPVERREIESKFNWGG